MFPLYLIKLSAGGSKNASKKDDEILNQILGNENVSLQKNSASCSNIPEVANQVDGTDIVRNLSLGKSTDTSTEAGSATPEDLRQLAVLEKQKHKTLKAERKPEEALKAFKKGKELERQAAALELALRKNSKKALSSSNIDDMQQNKDEAKASASKNKLPSQKSKGKDDLSAELKELGWSDLDLHDAEKKPATVSLEGELSSLLREVSQKPDKERRTVSADKSKVIAHKKRALELKRAGNLLEAKEELKRAKILERKIEEEELLGGGSDDSDDELSSLIRSMDADERADFSGTYKSNMNLDFDQLIGMADDIALDGNFEITDEDMNDPEIFSALKSFGWEEDAADSEDLGSQVASSKRDSLVNEIQSLKREALNQKRAGNATDALALLRKAKLLEKELENSDSHESDLMNQDSAISKKGALLESVEEPPLSSRASTKDAGPKSAPKSKLVIQKELIALKKKALALRREGRLDESDEELSKAKALEQQLEDMNKAPSVAQPSIGNRQIYNIQAIPDNGEEDEVTDQDLHDPSYLSLLKNLGWEEDGNADVASTLQENNQSQKYIGAPSISQYVVDVEVMTSKKSNTEIQRELLTLKRKALTLRRQGEAEEADEVLNKARLLEAQLNESEEPIQIHNSPEINKGNGSNDALLTTPSSLQVDPHNSRAEDSTKQVKNEIRPEKPHNIPHENEKRQELHASQPTVSQPHSGSLQQEILAHKRKAVALKRDGKLAEAKEELRQAKLLEKRMEEVPQTTTNSSDTSASDVSSVDKEASPSSVSKPLSGREKFKLQQESLGHKRQALKLRREGKTAEADAEFELAKAIESRLQESDPHDSGEAADDVSIEDFLDPQLMSALQSIGLDDVQSKSSKRKASETQTPEPTKVNSDANMERAQLVEQIKAEKVKAVSLKRSGKQAEALDALRRAKLYEKKLQSLT